MQKPSTLLDPNALRRYAKRALRFDPKDNYLARRCGEELLDRLDLVRLKTDVILDLGCGAGIEAEQLSARYPDALVLGMDCVLEGSNLEGFNVEAKTSWHPCLADGVRLPLPDNRVNLVLANLLLPWIDAPAALLEICRVLRPDGLLIMSTFGPDTLLELEDAWAGADKNPHVHVFQDMHNLGDQLVQSGFSEPVMDADPIGLTYLNARSLAEDLRRLGGANAREDRRRSLTGKNRWKRFEEKYQPLERDEGRIRATFELVYGIAWARSSGEHTGDSLRVTFEG